MSTLVLECKAILIYIRRNLLLYVVIGFITHWITEPFLQEVVVVLLSYILIHKLFVDFERYNGLLMFHKLRYFSFRVLAYIVLALLMSHTYVVLFVGLLSLTFTTLNKQLGIIGILTYYVLRIEELEIIKIVHRMEFLSDYIYVIVYVVLLNCVSLVIYMSKDIENN